MKTFGEFFSNLRHRAEKTGRTDSACRGMDSYKNRYSEKGWNVLKNRKLSIANFRHFCVAMSRAGVRRLVEDAKGGRFDSCHFGWDLDSFHEFYHATLEEARTCGLDVQRLVGRQSIKGVGEIKSTQK